MSFKPFKYRKLNQFEETYVCSVLSDINTIITKWKNLCPNLKFGQVKHHLLNSPAEMPIVSDEQRAELASDVEKIAMLRQPNHEILGGRTVEDAVLEGYCGIIYHLANRWFMKEINGITKQDIYQELYLKIWDIMFRYSPERGALSTFLWRSIKNRIYTVLNTQGRPLSHLRSTGLKLMAQFDKAKKSMPDSSISEVIESMSLSKKKRSHLMDCLRSVKSQSQIRKDSSSDSQDWDYKALSLNNDKTETDILAEKMFVDEILEKSNLNENERKIIEASMEPYHGWQTDITKEIVSEKTGKTFSKMRISQMLQKAREKVAQKIESEK